MEETAAEAAYAAALDEIERVKREGGRELDLSSEPYRALDRIPPEVAGIEGLQEFSLSQTEICDLAPLAGLTALRKLVLNQTAVADLTPLAEIASLQWLELSQTAVADVTPIAGLTGLRWLEFNQTAVADLAPLASHTALQGLYFATTAVCDSTPLSGLTALRGLGCNQTKVADLQPIASLTALRWLWLSDTAVADISPISNLIGLEGLGLSQTSVTDLAPLARLTALQVLWLDRTAIFDLAPLRNLTALADLTLNTSNISDLRPISKMVMLGTNRPPGLSFADTPATRLDAELARLALVEDEEDRARQTLAYLNSLPPWPEPYTPKARPDGLPPEPIGALPAPPEQDAALPLIWGEKGFAFLAAQIGADSVTEAVLGDLLPLIEDLRRKGNRHDDLYRLAGELQERATGEISTLNMVKLHLSYQKLRRVYLGREGRAERFDDETVSAIAGVLEIVPGVTLADAGVQVLIERQEQERARKVAPEVAAAEAQVLVSVQAEDAPFDPAVKDAARVILLPGMDDRLSASRGISRGIPWSWC
ncbi:hypothetical protein FALB51S_02952 [Frigidibacter albus]